MANGNHSPKEEYLTIPNVITSVRIVGSFVLFFLKIHTLPFLIVYGVCGVSDALDGFVARRTKTTSDFGKRLDSVSDLLFYLMMAYKMLGELLDTLHPIVTWTVFGLLFIRVLLYIGTALKFKTFLSSHSIFNKATGLVVFLIPYTIIFDPFFFYYSIFGCVVAGVGTVYEIVNLVRSSRNGKAQKSCGHTNEDPG